MEKSIVSVNFMNNRTGRFGTGVYNYYATIPLKIGDVVRVPTANGSSVARIAAVNIPESKVDSRLLPILKTIDALIPVEEDSENEQ